jgi:hypothetical protein
MTTVLICDDELPRLEEWADAVTALQMPDATVDALETGVLASSIEALEDRRLQARRQPMEVDPAADTPFDSADVVIIDQDLLRLGQDDGQRFAGTPSGDDLAYLVRCYSSAGVIVLMNRGSENGFDLRLVPDLNVFADLEIGSQQLGLRGLWTEWTEPQFRPWAWPLLIQMVADQAERLQQVDLAAPVLETLGLSPEMIGREQLEFFGVEAEAFDVTFGDAARSGPSGLRRKDQPMNEDALRRIAAARVHRWLDTSLVAGQDVLVDAPHLVSRFPSVLAGDAADIAAWNRAAHLPEVADTITNAVAQAEYPHRTWTSRRLWYWNAVSRNEEIAEVREPWAVAQSGQFAFCEDVSAFLEQSQVRPFVAAVSSPFVRRFVVNRAVGSPYSDVVGGIEYAPGDRFSG